MQRLAVDLEEESLVGPQARVRDMAPPGPHGVLERDRRIRNELPHRVPLPPLDLLHDGDPQAVLGAEVVTQHAMARTELRGEAAQGQVGEGTYTLRPGANGGTQIEFEYRWLVAPLLDRLTAPFVRSYLRRNNSTSMRRLAELLTAQRGTAMRNS